MYYDAMTKKTTKKKVRRGGSKPRPDMHSKKRSGYVAMSLRVSVPEARLIRAASANQDMSANLWMSKLVLAAAKKELAAAAKATPESGG
jgi:hypothetical protein